MTSNTAQRLFVASPAAARRAFEPTTAVIPVELSPNEVDVQTTGTYLTVNAGNGVTVIISIRERSTDHG